MTELSAELTCQALHPAMPQKLPLRAAELVAIGWTRGTAATDADGQKAPVDGAAGYRLVCIR